MANPLTPEQVLNKSYRIVENAGFKVPELGCHNFSEYANFVADILRYEYSAQERTKIYRFWDWCEGFRRLKDRFDREAAADPMILYRPMHQIALDFHSSDAFIRYFRAGNRTSKTQSGYAEHYFVTTGQHRWRHFGPPPHRTFIVAGLPYTQYQKPVFEAKFISGEGSMNPVSPMFPVGGKWLNHYDERKYEITLACPPCAHAGKGGTCRHQKSKIKLFSHESGAKEIEAFSATLAHGDEPIPEEFFGAMKMRIADQARAGSCMIFTGTPRFGTDMWETALLADMANGDPAINLYDKDDPDGPKMVEMFEVNQYEAGIIDPKRIDANMGDMDEFEIQARVYGKPAPAATNPVFNPHKIADLMKKVREPTLMELSTNCPLEAADQSNIKAEPAEVVKGEVWSGWRVWEQPRQDALAYIAAVDSAKGLRKPKVTDAGTSRGGDASCCSILKVWVDDQFRIRQSLVAQYHGWLNTLDYADEVFKGGMYYSVGDQPAMVVVELTGGYGEAVMLRLRKQLFYWNLYRGTKLESSVGQEDDYKYGIDTTPQSKPLMVATLRQMIDGELIDIPCKETLMELRNFEQISKNASGQALTNVRYEGAGGAYDDRVMSLCIGAVIMVKLPYLSALIEERIEEMKIGKMTDDQAYMYPEADVGPLPEYF